MSKARRTPKAELGREQVVRELWTRGVLAWKLRPVQVKIYEGFNSQRPGLWYVVNSSRRLGKTYTLATLALEECLRTPRAQVRYFAPTIKALKKIVIPVLREIMKDMPDVLRPEWKVQDSVWAFKHNGSELHLHGANGGHAEDGRGTATDLAVVDEAGFVDDLRYLLGDIITPQLLTTGGRGIIASTPPRTPAHDFAEVAHEAEAEERYAHFTIHEAGYETSVIERFKREAGGEHTTTWKREYLAEFVVDDEYRLCPEWREDGVTDVTRTDLFRYWAYYESMDIGVRDQTVVLFGYYDFNKATLVIEDELALKGAAVTTEEVARVIRDREVRLGLRSESGMVKQPALRVADNNNLILLQDLSTMHDLSFVPTSKDNLIAMVNAVRVFVNAGRLRVHPRCVQTAGCLRYGIWNDQRKEFARSTTYGHYDAFAALMYMIRNLDVSYNPVPADLGVDRANTFINRGHFEGKDQRTVIRDALKLDPKIYRFHRR